MTYLALTFLIAATALLLIWGIVRTERIFQFPFFVGAIFAAFVVPQSFALIRNPGVVPESSITMTLFYAGICALAALVGYMLPVSPSITSMMAFPSVARRRVHVGLLFCLIGLLASRFLAQETADQAAWTTGLATKYYFFAVLLIPGVTILLFEGLGQRILWMIALGSLGLLEQLRMALAAGRREPIAEIFITAGLVLYCTKGWRPPRWLAIAAIIAMALLIPYAGTYRQVLAGSQTEQLSSEDVLLKFSRHLTEGGPLEMRNAAALIHNSVASGHISGGTGYWNMIVFRFVPGQFIGLEAKQALMFSPLVPGDYDSPQVIRYTNPRGTTYTGIGDTFEELSYLGFFVFMLVAWIYRNIWFGVERSGMLARIIYAGLAASAMTLVTHGSRRFFPDMIYLVFFVGLAALYARRKAGDPSEEQSGGWAAVPPPPPAILLVVHGWAPGDGPRSLR